MRKNSIFVNHGGGHTKLKQVQNIEGAVLVKFSKQEWKSVQGNKQVKNITIFLLQIYTLHKVGSLILLDRVYISPCTMHMYQVT